MAPTMSKAALLLSSYARRKRKGYCSRKRRLRPTCAFAHSTSRRVPKSKQLSQLSKHTEAGVKDKGIYMQAYGIVLCHPNRAVCRLFYIYILEES